MSKAEADLFKHAPKEATHARIHSTGIDFYKREHGKWLYEHHGSWKLAMGTSEECCVERPKSQSWSGPEDGLPPIGSHVMVHECSHEYTKQFNDQTVRIVAHDEGKYAVFAADDFVYHALVAEKFKLPPTPEQLAAEERSKACDSMFGVILSLPEDRRHNRSDICEALYDAGFKREVK